ncbi:SPFH domain-containing protein [Pyxidicoccus sp. 3LFB2]
MSSTLPLLVPAGTVFLALVLTLLFVWRCYRHIGPHEALVVNGPQGVRVHLRRGAVVPPFLHRAEVMDLSTRTLELTLKGAQSLQCQDNLRADVRARFLLRITPTVEDVTKVALTLGVAKANSPEVLRELFEARCSEALRGVGRAMGFEEWLRRQDEFRDQVVRWMGKDLLGFTLEDVNLEEFAATPLSFYDSSNILDAEGIRRITEVTTHQHLARVQAETNARMEASRLQLEADEASFRAEQAKAEHDLQRSNPTAEPQALKSTLDAQVELARAKAAELEASFRSKVEKAQADGRAASADSGGTEGAGGPGFQAGLRKT